jgi:hypothetical protein
MPRSGVNINEYQYLSRCKQSSSKQSAPCGKYSKVKDLKILQRQRLFEVTPINGTR